ncbi:MAG: hypothetical protein MUD10_02235 [Candidatus Pacebacteria bacterium]|jgi:hypothetical protein|nr:hypothetical protein [Candidatus Paceibacterota bacterium]
MIDPETEKIASLIKEARIQGIVKKENNAIWMVADIGQGKSRSQIVKMLNERLEKIAFAIREKGLGCIVINAVWSDGLKDPFYGLLFGQIIVDGRLVFVCPTYEAAAKGLKLVNSADLDQQLLELYVRIDDARLIYNGGSGVWEGGEARQVVRGSLYDICEDKSLYSPSVGAVPHAFINQVDDICYVLSQRGDKYELVIYRTSKGFRCDFWHSISPVTQINLNNEYFETLSNAFEQLLLRLRRQYIGKGAEEEMHKWQ